MPGIMSEGSAEDSGPRCGARLRSRFPLRDVWIGSDLQQSRGAGAEQEVVDDFLVLQSQPRELVR